MDGHYEKIIRNIPVGIDGAIVRVLSDHNGRSKAIGRKGLVFEVGKLGFRVHERMVREVIKRMRRQGYLICSMPGEEGGYYLAVSKAEYQEFKQREFLAKVLDMQETLSAMDAAAQRAFDTVKQVSLGI